MHPLPKRSYIICTAPRSGSTLLCKMLASTNLAGQPDSHFHVPSFERWLITYELNSITFASRRDALRAIVKAAVARGTGKTDIFGLRLQRGSFDYFTRQLAHLSQGQMTDVERIESVFGPTVFVHLTRPDRLGQAISRVRAEQTGLWHRRSDGTELERIAPPKKPYYDAGAIKHHMQELEALDDAWVQWFKREQLTPLRINYDVLPANPQKALADVLAALGLDPARAQSVKTPTAKLADALSREWRERYQAEH